MFRFIHTADIHLDSPLKGLEAHEDAPVTEIREATRRAFDNLINLAIGEEVAFVLIAGDLYDGDWKDYNTGLFFAGRMGRLHQAGIKVFMVSGNHDAAGRMTKSLPLPDNVTIFPHNKPKSIQLDDLGVVIHGQGYASRSVTENLATRFPRFESGYFNIGLFHTSMNGREGHETYAPCTPDDLISKGYDYWALGHVHQREIVAEEPWIVFSGNIQGRHIRETGNKGAALITVEDGRVSEMVHHDLDVLRWAICRVHVADCESAEMIYERVRAALEQEQDAAGEKPLAVRLRLEGDCPLHAELHAEPGKWTEEFRAITAALGNVWLEKVKIKITRHATLEELAADDSPLAGLARTIETLDPAEDELTALIPELANLKSKLPAGILDPDSALEGNGAADLLPEVKEMLIAKLIKHGAEK